MCFTPAPQNLPAQVLIQTFIYTNRALSQARWRDGVCALRVQFLPLLAPRYITTRLFSREEFQTALNASD